MADRGVDFDLDLEEALAMIGRFTYAFDTVLRRALHSGAPIDMVMALDEASLGLHRARIALADLGEPTRTVDREPEMALGDWSKVAMVGATRRDAKSSTAHPRGDPT
jgi:hypothetical protein